MSTPNVPLKTQLGIDELRTRTHRLSQRHRTILLLVDGRRPLAEVLGLAQKAGSSISHFEDVLRMGLVELPIDVVAPDPVMTEPGVLATLRTTAVEVEVAPDDVPAEAVEPLPVLTVRTDTASAVRSVTTEEAAMLPAALMVTQDEAGSLGAPPDAESPLARADEPPHRPQPRHRTAAPAAFGAEPEAPAVEHDSPVVTERDSVAARLTAADGHPAPSLGPASPRAPESPALAPPRVPPTRPDAVAPARHPPTGGARPPKVGQHPEPVMLSELADVPAPDLSPAPAPTPDDAIVEQVRELLLHTVRQNPPPFVSRVPGRVAAARSLQDMRDLVLDIERYLSARRPRAGIAALQQARELLGLGNTVVAEDSRSWSDDDEDERPDFFSTTR